MTHVEALAAHLQKGEALLVTTAHDRRYLTGFPSSAGCVLITPEYACFLTDFRYIEAAERAITAMECRMYKRLSETLHELFAAHGVSRVYVQASAMPVAELRRWRELLPEAEWVGDASLDEWLHAERLCKTPQEIACIRQAQALTEYGFDHIVRYIRAGQTEREIALELEFCIRRQGAERVAFDFIVVSGANSALPHGVPTDKVVEPGDFITMDFGAVVDGWHTDMTRTVAAGQVSDEQKAVYNTVLQAQRASLKALHAGLSCKAGDAAARDVIAAAGYGDYFGHSTGHGVGVEIHEAPVMAPSAQDTCLQVGSVVTVEPGIYLPGRFGVRIEDMALITKDGCEDLTVSPKELLVL